MSCRLLLLFLAALALGGAYVESAAASRPGTQHAVYSDTWQGITFVAGLESCPVLGPNPSPWYVFGAVDLRDHIDSTYTPAALPLYQIDSRGSVHGVIDAPDGTYRVAGRQLEEHRTDTLDPRYFSGTGHVTISGPGGTVVGKATFQDLTEFPPPEFDLFFTSVTRCHLG